jgi:hypothetical protein
LRRMVKSPADKMAVALKPEVAAVGPISLFIVSARAFRPEVLTNLTDAKTLLSFIVRTVLAHPA